MKKKYVKPVILIEDFSLNTTIARDCENITNIPSYGVCGIEFGTKVIFSEEVNGCDDIVLPDDDLNNLICYHNPSDNTVLFTS